MFENESVNLNEIVFVGGEPIRVAGLLALGEALLFAMPHIFGAIKPVLKSTDASNIADSIQFTRNVLVSYVSSMSHGSFPPPPPPPNHVTSSHFPPTLPIPQPVSKRTKSDMDYAEAERIARELDRIEAQTREEEEMRQVLLLQQQFEEEDERERRARDFFECQICLCEEPVVSLLSPL
jgi:hypothetical protein